ncbi:MAG: O-antigen ligase family protein [Limisphaerales bacterium]
MDFAAIALFLVLYHLRVQEWVSVVRSIRLVAFSMAFAIVATLMRERGFKLRDLVKTPHDWFMVAFLIWTVATGPNWTWGQVYPVFLYYAMTVQALCRLDRLQWFLTLWAVMLIVTAGLAVASLYGFDPTSSFDVTNGVMKGRLILNTSIFNNPNALGHSIVPVVVMLFYLCFWKRPVAVKILLFPLLLLPLYCIYLTQSKGAYLAGFVAVVSCLTLGRPKAVQLGLLFFAITFGIGALYALPRMQDLNRGEQGIQGRIAAFGWGLNEMRSQTSGVGYGNWDPAFISQNHYQKSPHSSYVHIGGEEGEPGLFLFLGIIYCCLRTVVMAKTTTVAEERVRRLLFVLVICYVVSSWMVGQAWRATFFLMAAAIAAFHRHLLAQESPETEEAKEVAAARKREAQLAPALRLTPLQPAYTLATTVVPMTGITAALPGTSTGSGPRISGVEARQEVEVENNLWNRITWIDLLLVVVMTYATIRFWSYIITHF